MCWFIHTVCVCDRVELTLWNILRLIIQSLMRPFQKILSLTDPVEVHRLSFRYNRNSNDPRYPETRCSTLHHRLILCFSNRYLVNPGQISGQSSLQIHYVTEEDSGKYICTATNDMGSSTASADLHVEGKRQTSKLL